MYPYFTVYFCLLAFFILCFFAMLLKISKNLVEFIFFLLVVDFIVGLLEKTSLL